LPVSCLKCDQEIRIPSDAIGGEIVTCGDCSTSLELQTSEFAMITLRTGESARVEATKKVS
jgi:hypothetical protein